MPFFEGANHTQGRPPLVAVLFLCPIPGNDTGEYWRANKQGWRAILYSESIAYPAMMLAGYPVTCERSNQNGRKLLTPE